MLHWYEFVSKLSFHFDGNPNSLQNCILVSPKLKLKAPIFTTTRMANVPRLFSYKSNNHLPCFDCILDAAKYLTSEKVEIFPTFLRILCEMKNQNCACLDTSISDFAPNSL